MAVISFRIRLQIVVKREINQARVVKNRKEKVKSGLEDFTERWANLIGERVTAPSMWTQT